jgi:hypothetical protein
MPDDRKPAPPLDPEDSDPLDGDDDEVGEGGEGARSFVTDAFRKAFLAGVGAIFMTEEGARRFAREWKLPKEVLGYVTSQAAGAKDEVLRVVSEEIRKFFESEALRREFLKLLGSMSIEIHAEVRLKHAGEDRVRTQVEKLSLRPRSGAAKGEPGGGDADEDGDELA